MLAWFLSAVVIAVEGPAPRWLYITVAGGRNHSRGDSAETRIYFSFTHQAYVKTGQKLFKYHKNNVLNGDSATGGRAVSSVFDILAS